MTTDNNIEETKIYDTIVLATDAEAKTITFKTPDGSELVFATGYGGFKAGDIGCLSLHERDGKQEFSFPTYADQRLRRWPEHDTQPFADLEDEASRTQLWGWRLLQAEGQADEGKPLLVKAGLLPGKDGRVIEDQTEPVQLDVPPEFFELCESKGLTAEQVLRGFIADLCELQNYIVLPREDGYSSNGSDERMMANDYFERAYGMLGDDL